MVLNDVNLVVGEILPPFLFNLKNEIIMKKLSKMLVVMFVCMFIFTTLLIVHDVMVDKLAWLPYDVVICIISIFGAVQFAEDLV